MLIRFLSKRCTPDDIRRVNEWIEADEANREWLFEAERVWSLKDELRFSDRREIESAYNRFMSRRKLRQRRGNRRLLTGFLKYAAAALILGVLSYGASRFFKTENRETTFNIVEVPAGQRVSLTLSDGTKVWLNSKSKFTYPVSFSRNDRTVRLDGEGYFEVARDDEKHFIVKGASLEATVLGTKFNMKVYDDEAVVSLTAGKLKVSMAEHDCEVILHPKEKAVRQGERLEVLPVTGEEDAMWKNGIIAFRETPLPEALKTLSRHYNAHFESTNINGENVKITLKITDEPLDITMEYIRLATGLNCAIIKNDSRSDVPYNVLLSE
ncbi:MAG: FecR domain-containing protein [Tannerella sp.]|nr:FecR domain-containing protein [Tannerella sp.]